jgi:serine/threonine protein kinase
VLWKPSIVACVQTGERHVPAVFKRSVIGTMERYKKIEKTNPDSTLGEGAYGVVYKAIDMLTNRAVALKKIRIEIEDEGIPTTALREIVLLRQLEHPNVVKLENVVMDPARLYLVFELVDTDLKKYMDSNKAPLAPELVQSYTLQILEGLAYCHSMGVMHRDLKPQNILVTRDGGLKIADFGLARAFTPQHRPLTVEVVTRWYRAPEILLGCNTYSAAVDVWSVGCIVVEMANKRAFLPGDSEIDQLHKIFLELGTPSPVTWPGVDAFPYWRTSFPRCPQNARWPLQTSDLFRIAFSALPFRLQLC